MARKSQIKKPRPKTPSSSSWDERLRLIPGYDPIATAGDCRFDAEKAAHVCDFFPTCLQHVKGELAGKPFELQPWEQAILGNIFGWVRSDGTRRYRKAFIFLPRKNGKTALAAGIVLYCLLFDGEAGAEVYSAAADRDQAALIYQQVKGMVLLEPRLAARLKVYETAKSVVSEATSSTYKAISADANTKHGYNSHLVVIDELHAQPNRDLVDVLITSTGARRQPLVVFITTSDFDRPSICNETHDYACKVRDGIIVDSAFLPVVYEATRDDDWKSPSVWAKANPNLNISIKEEYLAAECKRAQEQPTYENTFKRLHLNIKTEQDVRWIQMDKWDRCAGADGPSPQGRPCYAGLDLASTTDIAAFVLYFPEDGHLLLPYFWVPGENAKRREDRDRVPYLTWARQELVTMTPGNVIDYDRIRMDIRSVGEIFDIREIAVDRWNSTHLQRQLQDDGFTVVPFGQGFASMSAPTKEFEKLVLEGALQHRGHPVLRWMASNVVVEMDAAGNLKPARDKSTEKIDGIVASVMAIGRAMVQESSGSVYESRGIEVLS